jgi:hypothetical protein
MTNTTLVIRGRSYSVDLDEPIERDMCTRSMRQTSEIIIGISSQETL